LDESARVFTAAGILTLVLGTVHGFSVLLEPLESSFYLSRAQASGFYSLALMCLTIAVLGSHKVIPGSHKHGILSHQDTFGKDNILTRGQTIEDIDESSAVDLVLRSGQISLHHARTVHGSMPNRGKQRRLGVALQCYMQPDCRQVIGENLAQVVRGCADLSGYTILSRPVEDMDRAAVNERERANKNWAEILYRGASQVRAY
jgi:hypothetical protein